MDLAGQYTNCDQLGKSGTLDIDRRTPEGDTISGFVDDIDGTGTDIDAVNGYIRSLVDRWTRARTYDYMASSPEYDDRAYHHHHHRLLRKKQHTKIHTHKKLTLKTYYNECGKIKTRL